MPFSSEASGVGYLQKATFGGNADAVGFDVKGKIGKLTFKKGLGNPAGVFTAKSASIGLLLPSTIYGTPPGTTGYPAAGLVGRHDPGREHRQAHGPAGQRARRDGTEPGFRPARHSRVSDLRSRPGYSLTNADDRHVGIDRQRERAGHPAQQRDQDRVRLHGVSRRASKERGAPARSPS